MSFESCFRAPLAIDMFPVLCSASQPDDVTFGKMAFREKVLRKISSLGPRGLFQDSREYPPSPHPLMTSHSGIPWYSKIWRKMSKIRRNMSKIWRNLWKIWTNMSKMCRNMSIICRNMKETWRYMKKYVDILYLYGPWNLEKFHARASSWDMGLGKISSFASI